jgi:hypothetical protein
MRHSRSGSAHADRAAYVLAACRTQVDVDRLMNGYAADTPVTGDRRPDRAAVIQALRQSADGCRLLPAVDRHLAQHGAAAVLEWAARHAAQEAAHRRADAAITSDRSDRDAVIAAMRRSADGRRRLSAVDRDLAEYGTAAVLRWAARHEAREAAHRCTTTTHAPPLTTPQNTVLSQGSSRSWMDVWLSLGSRWRRRTPQEEDVD